MAIQPAARAGCRQLPTLLDTRNGDCPVLCAELTQAMQTNVYLPQLELTMGSVTVTNVRVQEDACVTVEQPLIEVETGKAVSEVPAPKAGYVRKVFVKQDDQIGDKALLCILTDTLAEPFQDPTPPRLAPPAAAPNGRAEVRPSMPLTTTRSEPSEG